jgi:Protein of unknown function (DUF2845)
MRRTTTLVYVLLFVVPEVCAADESFRCGNVLVSVDISVAELLKKCGDPTSKSVSNQDDLNSDGIKVGIWSTEIWRYERGTRAAPMIVTIVNGQIRSMERGK